jgi:ABC-type multidrug transport system ATPase subunit
VYSDADVYLLDDPLSAVDAEVGRHLYDKCICGILKDKARILVTHQLQFLKSADEILLLNAGKVDAQGDYTALLKTGINFAQLLKSDDAHHHHDSPEHSQLKYKGTGMEVLSAAPNTNKGNRPEFRRSASMSLLEMGTIANLLVPDEFQWEEEPSIVKSYGHNYHFDKRM